MPRTEREMDEAADRACEARKENYEAKHAHLPDQGTCDECGEDFPKWSNGPSICDPCWEDRNERTCKCCGDVLLPEPGMCQECKTAEAEWNDDDSSVWDELADEVNRGR